MEVFFKDIVAVYAILKDQDCLALENHPAGDILFGYVHNFRVNFDRLKIPDSDIKETMVKAGFPEDHRLIERVLSYK